MDTNKLNIDLEELNNLSPEERQVALEILQQYATSGKSELHESLKNYDWEETPVDIHTFIHDKKYLGNALYDAEGRFTVFPYWEKCLEDTFPTSTTTKYNTIVLTGAIGIGKSTYAVICQLYMLYRLLCLKDPYQYYGMQPIDKISISFMNINLENARGVALDKFNQMILSSEWFMAHGEMRGITRFNYHPKKHIELVAASSNNQIIGRCLFCNFSDEANFMGVSNVEKAKKKMIKLITQIDARMKSRFMRGTYLPTLNIIASSKDSEQSFLEDYIDTKRRAESKATLIVDEPQWVVDARKDSKEKFYVAIGNKLLPNELLPLNPSMTLLNEYEAKGYKLWKVPIGYLDTFQLNLDEAICSIIGIATAATLKYISGQKLVQTKVDTYENPFVKDIITVGNAKDDYTQYFDYFDISKVSATDLEKPLYIHIDHSLSGDKTGVAGVWIIGKEATVQANTNPEFSNEALNSLASEINQDLHFKLAFSVSVAAPKGAQVSFSKTRSFIRWLSEAGFDVKGISMDTYQSANLKQDLIGDGYNVTIQSVDRIQAEPGTSRKICLPYHFLKTIINERRIQIYQKCDLLTEELTSLERKTDGHIDHPTDGSKDQADALCLHGDTEVYLLSGQHKTIKELYKNFENQWVLAYNTLTKKLEPARIINVLNNGVKHNLIKVTLDNGKELICTEDHLLLTREGNYIPAKDSLNVSLMPFSYEHKVMYKNRDYPYIYQPNDDLTVTGIYLHKLVAESVYAQEKLNKQKELLEGQWVVIHHKDCNRFNNNPENLEYLTNVEHSAKHVSLNTTDTKRKQLSEFNKKKFADGSHIFLTFTKEQLRKLGHDSRVKWNKSERHRQLVSENNKKLVALHKHNFQLGDNNSHSEEANKKRQLTCLARYNSLNPMSSEEIQKKCRESCLKHNGYDNPFRSKAKQHEMSITKLKNWFDKVKTKYSISDDEVITLLDFKIMSYALGNPGVPMTEAYIKEANLPIDCSNSNLTEEIYEKIRTLGGCVKQFLKESGKESFTYGEFLNYHNNKIKSNKNRYRARFGKIPVDYNLIIRLGFKLYNHRVIKIESVPAAEVYDLQLDKIHNFALCVGIFVHNCGAAWLASHASEEFGYNFGDQIFTKDDEVVPDNSAKFKQQLKNSFEEELNKMYIDKLKSNIDQDISNNYSEEEIEEYNIWKDIKDGIICF